MRTGDDFQRQQKLRKPISVQKHPSSGLVSWRPMLLLFRIFKHNTVELHKVNGFETVQKQQKNEKKTCISLED